MRLWPVPNSGAITSQIVLWVQRYIMDVGTMTQQVEVPQRWYEAIVAMLASKLALEIAEVDTSLIPLLDQKANVALYTAQAEERDNSPMMMAPNIAVYTR
jgi:predicted thioredoxin/glutaredoxin